MIQIGASLAAARRARGLDLREAERITCMRGRYLTALEEERFDDLPGRTYARAFLRTYASALDLDADRLVAEFDEQLPPPPEPVVHPEPVRRRETRLRPPLLAGGAVTVLAAFLVWAEWSGGGGSPRSLAPTTQVPAASAATTPAKAPPTRHHRTQVATTPVSAPATLVVRAVSGPCWVLARQDGPNGPVLAQETLQTGQTLQLAAPRVWLRLGAPWNVSVRRGAKSLPSSTSGQPLDVTF